MNEASGDSQGLISQSAYARLKGWVPSYVCKLVKQGKIPLVDGRIDPAIADAALAAVQDGNREAVKAANAGRRGDGGPGARASERSYVENPLSRATVDDKTAAAALKQLEIDLRSGKACLTERVIKAVGDNQAAAAQMLDQMVERCFNRIAAETDPVRVRQMLQTEVREVKLAIAKFAESLPERITETAQ